VCCVTDSKGWCGPVLAVAAREGLRVLSRLPRHHRLHALVMAAHGSAERIERPLRKKTDEPEVYEILAMDATEPLAIDIPAATPEGKAQRQVLHIPARAVRVFSSALLRQKRKTLERTRRQEAKTVKRTIADWQAEVHACAEDAQRAAARHLAEADFITLTLSATIQVIEGPFRRQRGRPRKAPEPALQAQRHYRVTYTTAPACEAELEQRLRRAATFVQIRTRNPGWTITDAEMLDAYRCQYLCEHGFSWLKSGAGAKGINPIFLETPKRIASLCFLYVIGLMIWNLIQRTVRKNLTAWKTGLPYHRNKPSAKITTRFYFELFPSVQTIAYRMPGGTWQKKVLGLNQTTELAIKALGVRSDALVPL
jgi:transposase